MARKKAGVVTSVRKTLWAAWASLVAAVGGSVTAYFWGDIAKMLPGATANQPNHSAPIVAQVVGSLVNLKNAAPGVKVEMLGCDVTIDGERIIVANVEPGSPGALLGLVPGDIIETVDSRPITSTEILVGSLARSRQLLSTVVHVRRGNDVLRGDVVRNDEKLHVRRALTS